MLPASTRPASTLPASMRPASMRHSTPCPPMLPWMRQPTRSTQGRPAMPSGTHAAARTRAEAAWSAPTTTCARAPAGRCSANHAASVRDACPASRVSPTVCVGSSRADLASAPAVASGEPPASTAPGSAGTTRTSARRVAVRPRPAAEKGFLVVVGRAWTARVLGAERRFCRCDALRLPLRVRHPEIRQTLRVRSSRTSSRSRCP
jgi:hypothetical protein